ncbi:hypothetical protein AGRA3207_002823 [Actinomadura graeca]|uniref:Uncharacterized protein n=1 Tax=Actinomadura graeca TaxID=2750812 RepID=A0ABX8QWT9_9ACTN|nr:hypothetical protein [Actinomadura graeca]QXJ21912.1 hypothetical protein AGRA3207_002823 [Actinomadura graeca]
MTGWGEDDLARLRAAAHLRDGSGGLAALGDRPLGPVLQYAGDVLAAALAEGRAAARERAEECLAELDARDAPGDAELAADLAAALGTPRAAALPPLPADLGAIAAALEDTEPHVLDLVHGDVLHIGDLADEPAAEVYDPSRWLPIPPGRDLPEDEEARRGLARHWLADQGYRVV